MPSCHCYVPSPRAGPIMHSFVEHFVRYVVLDLMCLGYTALLLLT